MIIDNNVAEEKRILLIADLEGAINIKKHTKYDDMIRERFREFIVIFDILNEVFRDTEFHIYYCDCHTNMMRAMIGKKQTEKVHYISSIWEIDFQQKYDYALLIGFHANSFK